MFRFMFELIDPALKCDRVGHIDVPTSYYLLKVTFDCEYEADLYRAHVLQCKRCHRLLESKRRVEFLRPVDHIFLTDSERLSFLQSGEFIARPWNYV